MPGYKEYTEASQALRSIRVENFSGRWLDNTRYEYETANGRAVFDTSKRSSTPVRTFQPTPMPQAAPARGRQYTQAKSPDGRFEVNYRDGNIYLTVDGKESPLTTDGDLTKRIKFGSASWVYGEELNQQYAMGFSPNSRYLWYYMFDESQVKDYHIVLGHADQQSRLYPEAYPKPGQPNPSVELFIYDTQTKSSQKVQVRDGAFDNGVGHYVYSILWRDDSSELIFQRANRLQNIIELCAAEPTTGKLRVIDREANPSGWVEMNTWLDVTEGRPRRGGGTLPETMLIRSEADGYLNLYWLDTKTGTRTRITSEKSDVTQVVRVDSRKEVIWYMAAGTTTPYRHQLYSIDFKGNGRKIHTDPAFHHQVSLNESATAFMDVRSTSTEPPSLHFVSIANSGNTSTPVAASTVPTSGTNGFSPVQWYSFPTFDGTATLHGKIHKPRNFDPNKKYPVLLSVYGGPMPPSWGGTAETFSMPSALASAGYLIVEVYGRGGNGRGRQFRQAIYRKLGIVEIDDQAAGIEAMKQFPWADTSKVGAYGTSYGGYSSAMLLLRYPKLFHAAAASSMVSDWRNYDTTYTERYMGLLEDNKAGYDAGSCMTYAKNLEGWMMLYFGTADDNTHPSNTLQLCQALQRAGKYFELQAGVDQGHTGLNMARMMEFFTERLVVAPNK
ncbi:DPP IV N-terminal domain-containing protein [Kamptonema cortianum]|nr:DPP IV N-terminal domain-containing protein [Kamptonema cortianum]